MKALMIVAALTGGFTAYPGFNAKNATIEAYTDRGPIYEIIVRCPVGTAIISYSKSERLYCGPTGRCRSSLQSTVQEACQY
ncbi:MAG: hypothetical protein ACFCUN_11860 [Hyphomicrobiaceae bacterium]